MSLNNTPKVSIIIPAYNAEKSIRMAVESVLNQSFQESIQVVAINDGSKDNTGQILEEISTKDPRLLVIQKSKNEGLSAGRNSGLEHVTGEYVGFLDADDWMEHTMLEDIFRQIGAENPDLIVAGYSHDTMNEERTEVIVSRQVRMSSQIYKEKKEIIKCAAKCDSAKIFAYTWNKFYKREILNKNGYKFLNQTLIEDFIFNTTFWDAVQCLAIVDNVDYHYVKASKEALTQKFLPDFWNIMDLRFESMKALFQKNHLYEGESRSMIANMHIKHEIAGIIRNCSEKRNYSFSEQYRLTKGMLKSKNAVEVRKYAKGNNKNEKVCNLIFKSKNVLLNLMFAKTLYAMQKNSSGIFDKLK